MARQKRDADGDGDERVAFLLKLPPDVRDALRIRKALTGTDMTDTIVELLERELSEELAMVRARR